MRVSRRVLTAVVALVLVVALGVALGVRAHDSATDARGQSAPRAASDPGEKDGDATKEGGGSREIREALEKHPGLAAHRMPIAFVGEKLAQQGGGEEGDGEATGEILNGPAQESYDQRAYPHLTIKIKQVHRAQRADHRAEKRAATRKGQRTITHALGLKARHRAAAASWQAIGPNGGIQVKQATYTGKPAYVSGRATALAVLGSTCTRASCILLAGTAGGGLWKTTNALAAHPAWTPIGSEIPSTAIGSITVAGGSIYVGTGEPNGSSDNEAGRGLYVSTDGGTSFSKVSTTRNGKDFTLNRGLGAVAVDPNDARHILIGTEVARHGASSVNGGRFTPPGAAKVGVYETTNAGHSWRLALSRDTDTPIPGTPNGADFFRGGVSKILFDRTHPGTVYASMFDYGLFRATRAGGSWKQIYAIGNPGDPATSSTNRVEFATATLASGATRIYLGDSTYFDDAVAGLLRTDDATAASPSWTALSSPTEGTPGFGSYNFCEGQCYYDMVVASPPGHPAQVFLSGSMNYNELQAFGGPGSSNGRAIVRSADAGRHWTDMTNDDDNNGLHPDHHALTFAPTGSTQTFFSASDGGVVRQNGPYVDHSADCAARGLSGVELTDCQMWLSAIPTRNQSDNKGLQTLQYQSVSVSRSGVVQGGTQDNGTWESDRAGFAETIGGDGGQSGFNVNSQAIRYHSYYAPQHDVSFDGGSALGWDWISDPLLNSGEAASFYTPFTPDPVTAGTVFDGLQHVWRTTDNGGQRAYLDQHCNELTGDFTVTCGDWVPLGGDAGDLSGGNPSNYVVAVERAPSDASTMWVGTRLGGIWISGDADAANPDAVTFTELDQTLGLPQRFPSGIYIDPADPHHAFLSYSGYSAYSPGGHVFEVRFDPTSGHGTVRNLSANLGDQPVTDIVYTPATNAVFVSTDFGVLTRTLGHGGSWVATSGLPPVATYGLSYDHTSGTLYAATHGRSIWKLSVG